MKCDRGQITALAYVKVGLEVPCTKCCQEKVGLDGSNIYPANALITVLQSEQVALSLFEVISCK